MQALLQDEKLAGSRVLDASRSDVRLKSGRLWRLLPVKGIFRQVTGNSTVSAAEDVTGTITYFFDVVNHPDITFTVDGIRPDNGGVRVTGSLTVRGRTRLAELAELGPAKPCVSLPWFGS